MGVEQTEDGTGRDGTRYFELVWRRGDDKEAPHVTPASPWTSRNKSINMELAIHKCSGNNSFIFLDFPLSSSGSSKRTYSCTVFYPVYAWLCTVYTPKFVCLLCSTLNEYTMMFIAWTQKDALLFSCKTERAPPPIFAQLLSNYGCELKMREPMHNFMNILICGRQSDVGSHKACP